MTTNHKSKTTEKTSSVEAQRDSLIAEWNRLKDEQKWNEIPKTIKTVNTSELADEIYMVLLNNILRFVKELPVDHNAKLQLKGKTLNVYKPNYFRIKTLKALCLLLPRVINKKDRLLCRRIANSLGFKTLKAYRKDLQKSNKELKAEKKKLERKLTLLKKSA